MAAVGVAVAVVVVECLGLRQTHLEFGSLPWTRTCMQHMLTQDNEQVM